jgi:hypothetical protein
MIKMIEVKENCCPVFVCDECRERIKDAQEAIIIYNENEIRSIHKSCDSDKYRHSNGWRGWNDLDIWLYWLKENVKYKNERRIKQRAQVLEA